MNKKGGCKKQFAILTCFFLSPGAVTERRLEKTDRDDNHKPLAFKKRENKQDMKECIAVSSLLTREHAGSKKKVSQGHARASVKVSQAKKNRSLGRHDEKPPALQGQGAAKKKTSALEGQGAAKKKPCELENQGGSATKNPRAWATGIKGQGQRTQATKKTTQT